MSKQGSYWAGTGAHQAEFKRLRADLVTVAGTADTPHGELLRAVTHLYHDLKRTRLRNVAARWGDWQTVCAHRDRIAAAIGPQGTWVLAVVDRAITERYLTAMTGGRQPPSRFPHDAFEMLVDGCVLTVEALHAAA
jgi:hypothetical protein